MFRWLFNITNQFQVHAAANDEKGNIWAGTRISIDVQVDVLGKF